MDISLFLCALSNTKSEHIYEDPVVLSCGHLACRNCTLQQSYCQICGTKNTLNSSNTGSIVTLNEFIKNNLNHLFSFIDKKFKQTYDDLKIAKHLFEESIDTRVLLIKDEIQIRIDSLKAELDDLGEKMSRKLLNLRDKLFEEVFTDSVEFIQNKNLDLTFDNLYIYQRRLITLYNERNKYDHFRFNINFDVSELKLDSASIGIIHSNNDKCDTNTAEPSLNNFNLLKKELEDKNKTIEDLTNDLVILKDENEHIKNESRKLNELKERLEVKINKIYSTQLSLNEFLLKQDINSITNYDYFNYLRQFIKIIDLVWTFEEERDNYLIYLIAKLIQNILDKTNNEFPVRNFFLLNKKFISDAKNFFYVLKYRRIWYELNRNNDKIDSGFQTMIESNSFIPFLPVED